MEKLERSMWVITFDMCAGDGEVGGDDLGTMVLRARFSFFNGRKMGTSSTLPKKYCLNFVTVA